ncbi:DUF4296 domain-containing protein [Tamlana flava]|uniref:DUF4296 domain-containing protein n=1 Tax=Tamlana flava TaxID=3158572 RepID=UPI00351B3589
MILRKYLLAIVLVLMVVACKKVKGPDKPKNLISKKEMVNILIDAKLVSSASAMNKRIMRDSGMVIKNYVFVKYNIDSLQFAQSNDYYAFHIKDYEDIYTEVEDSLERLKQKLKEQEAEEWKMQTKREEDSLKAIKKDSAEVIEEKYSLSPLKRNDSIIKGLVDKKYEQNKKFLKPVSDTVSPLN